MNSPKLIALLSHGVKFLYSVVIHTTRIVYCILVTKQNITNFLCSVTLIVVSDQK